MSADPPEIWVARHGETEWSRTGRHTGRTDVPLTATGRREAVALGRALGGRRFALVLSSPLSRAWETCRLAGYADVEERTDDLLEWDYGAVEGRTSAEMRREQPGWTIWTGGVPLGETIESVAARAGKVIDRAIAAEGDVLLFAHGHVLRVLTARWLGLEPSNGRLFALGTAAMGMLGDENGARVIRAWNVSSVPSHF
ncbi:MAG TPA: histidine phosphatase family protein [Anaeromyxobacter sp.]